MSADPVAEVLQQHREGALTCYDHDGPGVWCCVCGEHELTGPWREHMADALREAGLIPEVTT